MPALAEDAISSKLSSVPDWRREGGEIVREFEFQGFGDAIAFVNRVAEVAEAADHHPDIDIRYNRVRLALSTHSEGGLTQKDFALASEIDSRSRA